MSVIKVHGIEEARRRIGEFAARGGNTRPLMGRISGIMMDAVEENFAAEGRPKWVDLKPATKRQRARKGKWPGQILQVSQAGLASSIQQFFTAEKAVVGTNKQYGRIHQLGGTIQRAARFGYARLRTDAKGNLLRQGGEGKDGQLAIFAKKSHKQVRKVPYVVTAYTITIPARPYLKLTAGDLDKIERAALDFLTGR